MASSDYSETIEYMNGIKIVKKYLILMDGYIHNYEEEHYNEWGVVFYRKGWHEDGSVWYIELYNSNARSNKEAMEVLLYSYRKAEDSLYEDIYKFDILKGRCLQYVGLTSKKSQEGYPASIIRVEKMSWEPAIWQ